MPTPQSGETKKDFIERCIPIVINDGTAKDGKQGYAVCNSIYDRSKSKSAASGDEAYVRLRGLANTAEIRTATFRNQEHLVVPVIALVGDAVVRPLHSKGPEFVPARELEIAPKGWDGRPVVPDHPNNGQASANEPSTLEKLQFGQLFNTRFEAGKLKTEAWLDLKQAQLVGRSALDVIEACKSGEMVEVSVGAWVVTEERSGIAPGGQKYEYVWHDIHPDHLAMGLDGSEGACSIDMGCGAPRAAKSKENDMDSRTLRDKIADFFLRSSRDGSQLSDMDIRDKLWESLTKSEPGFEGVAEVFSNPNSVVYWVGTPDALKWKKRNFTIDASGNVTLAEDVQSVEPVTSYQQVAASASASEPIVTTGNDTNGGQTSGTINLPPEGGKAKKAAGDCGCSKANKGGDATADNDRAKDAQGGTMPKIDELVGRLIANERSPFSDEDKDTLSALGEDKLSCLAGSFEEKPAPEPTKEPETVKAAEETEGKVEPGEEIVELKRRDFEKMRAASDAFEEQRAARKTELIAQIKEAQSEEGYTDEQLESKSNEDLETLSRILKANQPVRDFSGRGMPREPRTARKAPPMPEPYAKALKGDGDGDSAAN